MEIDENIERFVSFASELWNIKSKYEKGILKALCCGRIGVYVGLLDMVLMKMKQLRDLAM